MAGSSSTIEKLTNLSNKYITSLFYYYNEREEWDVEDERLRLLSLEPYMDPIEENKKNLKRYWGSSASAQQEIFTPESIIYVAEIDKLFEDRYTPGVTPLRKLTLKTLEVRDILYNSARSARATATGGGLKNKRKTKRINTKKKKKRKVKVRTKKKEKKRTVTKSRKARKSRKKRNQNHYKSSRNSTYFL